MSEGVSAWGECVGVHRAPQHRIRKDQPTANKREHSAERATSHARGGMALRKT